jgi:hypothetical protein
LFADIFQEIEGNLKKLKEITSKREKILSNNELLTKISLGLPIILALITSIAATITQQYLFTLINAVNTIPPAWLNINKNKIEKTTNQYNACIGLEVQLAEIQREINNLATTGLLKDKKQDIDKILKNLTKK